MGVRKGDTALQSRARPASLQHAMRRDSEGTGPNMEYRTTGGDKRMRIFAWIAVCCLR